MKKLVKECGFLQSVGESDLASTRRLNGEGNGTPLQCSCLENPMDGGAWWAAVRGVAKSRTRLSDFTFTFTLKNGMPDLSLTFYQANF